MRGERAKLVDDPSSLARTGTARIYGVVLGVGVCCALAIVSTYQWTLPIIQRKRVAQRSAAITAVLPTASAIVAYQFNPAIEGFETAEADAQGDNVIFVGFDAQQHPIGAVIETRGMGYQDYIRLIYAYSFRQQAIVGMRVLESRETPGLGDRIESDEDFLNNFVELDVSVTGNRRQIAHKIEYVKPGEKESAWQIDGITGATISSRAVAEMLRDSTARWIPIIELHRGDFRIKEVSS